MAVWFHDEDGLSDSHMLRPLEAALAIHRATMRLNQEFILPFPLRIGAGLNTGYAMVGNTGSAGSADYTALGDTVNAAFRLESATKDIGCDVAIGEEATYRCANLQRRTTSKISQRFWGPIWGHDESARPAKTRQNAGLRRH